jgi:hypothetical protein
MLLTFPQPFFVWFRVLDLPFAILYSSRVHLDRGFVHRVVSRRWRLWGETAAGGSGEGANPATRKPDCISSRLLVCNAFEPTVNGVDPSAAGAGEVRVRFFAQAPATTLAGRARSRHLRVRPLATCLYAAREERRSRKM